MYYVYIKGIHSGATGLGNTLFQVAAAIYYAEKYNMNIVMERNYITLFGTSVLFGRNKILYDQEGDYHGYDSTIFKKITFVDKLNLDNTVIIDNYFTSNKIVPQNTNVLIEGFSQNKYLFNEYIEKLPKYLYFEDEKMFQYLKNKYGDVSNSVCVGIRIGNDFEHMKKITPASYKKALDYYKNHGVNIDKIYVISDVPSIKEKNFDLMPEHKYVEVVENDIAQMYFALMCKNHILSESTFHLWIAYIATSMKPSTQVICFNDTDITNRNLQLDHWTRMDY